MREFTADFLNEWTMKWISVLISVVSKYRAHRFPRFKCFVKLIICFDTGEVIFNLLELLNTGFIPSPLFLKMHKPLWRKWSWEVSYHSFAEELCAYCCVFGGQSNFKKNAAAPNRKSKGSKKEKLLPKEAKNILSWIALNCW